MKTSWQVATAAEAFAAAQFSRCGWDVSVQYGANQPEYDLVVVNGNRLLKVSVKGSRDGSWGLTQSFLKSAAYHEAIDVWLRKHTEKTIFCLVQFKNVSLKELPRMYVVTPTELASHLKRCAGNRGDTILHEYHEWGPRAKASGTIDHIPESWEFTEERIEEICKTLNQHESLYG